MYTFNNEVTEVGQYGAAAEVGPKLSEALGRVRPGGQTALNDAICTAVQAAEVARDEDRAAGENRLYGVVVLIGWSGKSEQSEGCLRVLCRRARTSKASRSLRSRMVRMPMPRF